MRFCDYYGNLLKKGTLYCDFDKLNNSDKYRVPYCKVVQIGEDFFELEYSDKTKKNFDIFDMPESLVSKAKSLVPLERKDLERILHFLEQEKSWIERNLSF